MNKLCTKFCNTEVGIVSGSNLLTISKLILFDIYRLQVISHLQNQLEYCRIFVHSLFVSVCDYKCHKLDT